MVSIYIRDFCAHQWKSTTKSGFSRCSGLHPLSLLHMTSCPERGVSTEKKSCVALNPYQALRTAKIDFYHFNSFKISEGARFSSTDGEVSHLA